MTTYDDSPQSFDVTIDARRTPLRTVLPRVETIGEEVRLVSDGRPRYELCGKLGEGGVGEVMRAIDHDIGRRVALKRLRREAKEAHGLVRFVEEVRVTGRLEHPNIVPIHDVGVDERGDHYFVMKYVDGETLQAIIARLAAGDPATHARFPVARRLDIFASLLGAVAFAHQNGIIHRDIKPANVMVGAHGEVVLMDWGVAKDLRAERAPTTSDAPPSDRPFETADGSIVGTPAYMAPEQVQGLPADERCDVYALSVLLYELLTLTHPFAQARSTMELLRAVVQGDIPAADAVAHRNQDAIPAEVVWFLRRGLARDREARFQRVDEMIAWFAARSRGVIPVDCPVTFLKRATLLAGRVLDAHPYRTMAALAAVVLFVLGSMTVAVARAL